MSRAQDLLDEAINTIRSVVGALSDASLATRAEGAAGSLENHREKFFFKSLAGVPLANKAKKSAQAVADEPSAASLAALEAVLAEIDEKADAPGTVLT